MCDVVEEDGVVDYVVVDDDVVGDDVDVGVDVVIV